MPELPQSLASYRLRFQEDGFLYLKGVVDRRKLEELDDGSAGTVTMRKITFDVTGQERATKSARAGSACGD